MSESPSSPAPRFRLQLLDLSALVVGYGMAAVLFRAFWPRGEVSPGILGFAIGFYVWLGLAMSGPLLLLRHRTAVNPGEQSPRSERVPVANLGRDGLAADRGLLVRHGRFHLADPPPQLQVQRHAPLRPRTTGCRPALPAVRIEGLSRKPCRRLDSSGGRCACSSPGRSPGSA